MKSGKMRGRGEKCGNEGQKRRREEGKVEEEAEKNARIEKERKSEI